MGSLKRILFCSPHSLADPASGAAISALETLSMLRQRGWAVEVLCGEATDGEAFPGKRPAAPPGPIAQVGHHAVRRFEHRDLTIRAVSAEPDCPSELRDLALPLLLEAELRRQKFDLMITYGGGWQGRALLKIARRAGVPSAFWLRNALYQQRDLFDDVAGCVVPSSFLAKHYLATMGLRTEIGFAIVERDRVRCPVRQPNYVTFVSPLLEKGASFYARLASELARLRPDIDLLVVEGRGSAQVLDGFGLDVTRIPNLRVAPRAADPRSFLAVTRMLVYPSVWPEPFGRTIVEAMVNGIPVVASDRGGLPEAIGIGGVTLPLPERISMTHPALATVGEVEPWISQITALWDDDDAYDALSRKASASASRFDPDTLADRHDAVFRRWAESTPSPLLGPDPLVAAGYPADADTARAQMAEVVGRANDLLA